MIVTNNLKPHETKCDLGKDLVVYVFGLSLTERYSQLLSERHSQADD